MELLDHVVTEIQEKEAIHFTRSLIKLPSVMGNEGEIAQYLSNELTALGLSVEWVEAKKGRPNLIAHIDGESDEDGLMLVGHTDTVPLGKGEKSWKLNPFDGEIDGGFIYGLGACDMKGGVATILLAVKAILKSKVKLKKPLTIIFCVDEEGGSVDGTKYISEKKLLKGRLAIEPEPTNMRIQAWYKGRTWYEVEIRGKSAHPLNPLKGVNAIHHMVDIVHKIIHSGFKHTQHELLGGCTVSFGTIDGGTSVKFIPDLCRSTLEVRTVPGQTGGRVLEEIRNYIGELKETDRTLDANVRILDGKDPIELDPKDAIIDVTQGVIEKALGKRAELGREGNAAGDLYFLWKNFGIPGIMFGPGDPGCAHSPNECVEAKKILDAARCYVGFILEFCGGYLETP